jgi:hypothetical protein
MSIDMDNTNPQIAKGMIGAMLDETISEEEMDRLLAEDIDEINDLLQEAYDEKARGEFAPLEPLHILLAEERARFKANRG